VTELIMVLVFISVLFALWVLAVRVLA